MWRKSLAVFLLFTIPTSTNYQLQEYGFGSGGTTASSSSYQAEFLTGEQGSSGASGENFQTLPGLIFAQMAAVPPAPTVVNDGTYSNKLAITLNTGSNPSDTLFAIAASTDEFATSQYVQSDNTLANTLESEDWKTFADWGGATGTVVIGLTADTTYAFRVKAVHGNYTESGWGPAASASTSPLQLTFDLDVSVQDEETSAPYGVELGSLQGGSITTSSEHVWVDFTTNASAGGFVYLYGSNSGLFSSSANHTISAVSANLSSLEEGYGIQSSSTTQAVGGPLIALSPFDGTGEVVGQITPNPQAVFSSSGAPVTGGRASFTTKAKITTLTPAAGDYTDTLTVVAAGTF